MYSRGSCHGVTQNESTGPWGSRSSERSSRGASRRRSRCGARRPATAQIVTVQMEEIESEIGEPVAAALGDVVLHIADVCGALLVRNRNFTV